jgi:hypothetical protein
MGSDFYRFCPFADLADSAPRSFTFRPLPSIFSTIMFTLQDFTENKCTEQEFYRQFIDETVLQIVSVGIGRRAIFASRDSQFRDIPERDWDLISPALQRHLKPKIKQAGGFISISLLVRVAKQAARQIKEERVAA